MRDSKQGGALTEVTFYILLALTEPRHGYAVKQYIEEKTGGRLQLGAGTLYGALTALEKRGWIETVSTEWSKKTYRLTVEGERAAQRELQRLREVTETAEKLLGGKRDE